MTNQDLFEARGPYRSRNGLILGVCGGIAEYFDFSKFWLRMLTLIAFLLTGFFPVVFLYVIAALLMKRAPLLPSGCDPQWTRRIYSDGRRAAGSLDERLRRMEQAAR